MFSKLLNVCLNADHSQLKSPWSVASPLSKASNHISLQCNLQTSYFSQENWEIKKIKAQIQPTHHTYHKEQPKFFILVGLCKIGNNVFSDIWVPGHRLILSSTSAANYKRYHDIKFCVSFTKQTKARSLRLEECDLSRLLRKKKCCYNFDNII